jgi:hypothetical protein
MQSVGLSMTRRASKVGKGESDMASWLGTAVTPPAYRRFELASLSHHVTKACFFCTLGSYMCVTAQIIKSRTYLSQLRLGVANEHWALESQPSVIRHVTQ